MGLEIFLYVKSTRFGPKST